MERERRRRRTILYYLEDDSVQVTEPPEHNSGIPQGALKTRQIESGKTWGAIQ